MLPFVLAALTQVTPSPAPSDPPLKVIVDIRSSALCTALRQNIGPALAAMMSDDQAVAASKPLLIRMSHDYMSSQNINQAGWGNLNAPIATDHSSAAMELDTSHLEELIGVLTHNLQMIDAALADPKRFPKEVKTDADRKLLEIKAQLQAVAAQQRQALDVLNGLVDTRRMEQVANRGDDVANLFGLNDGNNSHISGSNNQFDAGPLGTTPVNAKDPAISQSDFSSLSASVFGRFYRIVILEQQVISQKEAPASKNVLAAATACAVPKQ